jgi:hypothetical protein
MSGVQLGIVAIIAAVVTVPIVKFIPRARQSLAFDRVLWGATWLLAFLGAWYAVDNYGGGARLAGLALDEFARAAGGMIFVGALAGALSLNVLLWLMDRFTVFDASETDETASEENSIAEDKDGAEPESR